MLEKMRKNKNIIINITLVVLIVIITIITTKVLLDKNIVIDKIAHDLIVENLRHAPITNIMLLFTSLSNTEIIVIIALVLALIIKDKRVAISIPINLALIASINQILKFIIKRPRPIGYRLLEIDGYSFPSGHAMVSMAFYGLLIYLAYKLIKNKNVKIIVIILNFIIIILVGISRIYLGVHYCSDVLIGYCASIIYLIVYIKILKKYKIIS